jgi:hypothetical protein
VCVVARQQSLTRQLHVALEGSGTSARVQSCAELPPRAGSWRSPRSWCKLEEGRSRLMELAQLRATQRHPAPIVVIGESAGFDDYLASVRTCADGYFAVPLDLAAAGGAHPQLIERGRGDPLRVLLVDDDPDFLAACGPSCATPACRSGGAGPVRRARSAVRIPARGGAGRHPDAAVHRPGTGGR